MAKRRAKINRSDKVREYLEQHPDANTWEVCEDLALYEVKPALVATVKSRLRRKDRPIGGQPTDAVQVGSEAVVAAARLIQICGGVTGATKALKTAEQVAQALRS